MQLRSPAFFMQVVVPATILVSAGTKLSVSSILYMLCFILMVAVQLHERKAPRLASYTRITHLLSLSSSSSIVAHIVTGILEVQGVIPANHDLIRHLGLGFYKHLANNVRHVLTDVLALLCSFASYYLLRRYSLRAVDSILVYSVKRTTLADLHTNPQADNGPKEDTSTPRVSSNTWTAILLSLLGVAAASLPSLLSLAYLTVFAVLLWLWTTEHNSLVRIRRNMLRAHLFLGPTHIIFVYVSQFDESDHFLPSWIGVVRFFVNDRLTSNLEALLNFFSVLTLFVVNVQFQQSQKRARLDMYRRMRHLGVYARTIGRVRKPTREAPPADDSFLTTASTANDLAQPLLATSHPQHDPGTRPLSARSDFAIAGSFQPPTVPSLRLNEDNGASSSDATNMETTHAASSSSVRSAAPRQSTLLVPRARRRNRKGSDASSHTADVADDDHPAHDSDSSRSDSDASPSKRPYAHSAKQQGQVQFAWSILAYLASLSRQQTLNITYVVFIIWGVSLPGFITLPLVLLAFVAVLRVDDHFVHALLAPIVAYVLAFILLQDIVNMDSDVVAPSIVVQQFGLRRLASPFLAIGLQLVGAIILAIANRYGRHDGFGPHGDHQLPQPADKAAAPQWWKEMTGEGNSQDDDARSNVSIDPTENSAASRVSEVGLFDRFLDSLTSFLGSAKEFLIMLAQWFVGMIVVHAFRATVLGLILCVIQRVTVFNAVFLFICLLFFCFPHFAERTWLGLVVYCQAVVVTIIIWQLVWFKDTEVSEYIGLDHFTTLWAGIFWELLILLLATVQLNTFRSATFQSMRRTYDTLRTTDSSGRHFRFLSADAWDDDVEHTLLQHSAGYVAPAQAAMASVSRRSRRMPKSTDSGNSDDRDAATEKASARDRSRWQAAVWFDKLSKLLAWLSDAFLLYACILLLLLVPMILRANVLSLIHLVMGALLVVFHEANRHLRPILIHVWPVFIFLSSVVVFMRYVFQFPVVSRGIAASLSANGSAFEPGDLGIGLTKGFSLGQIDPVIAGDLAVFVFSVLYWRLLERDQAMRRMRNSTGQLVELVRQWVVTDKDKDTDTWERIAYAIQFVRWLLEINTPRLVLFFLFYSGVTDWRSVSVLSAIVVLMACFSVPLRHLSRTRMVVILSVYQAIMVAKYVYQFEGMHENPGLIDAWIGLVHYPTPWHAFRSDFLVLLFAIVNSTLRRDSTRSRQELARLEETRLFTRVSKLFHRYGFEFVILTVLVASYVRMDLIGLINLSFGGACVAFKRNTIKRIWIGFCFLSLTSLLWQYSVLLLNATGSPIHPPWHHIQSSETVDWLGLHNSTPTELLSDFFVVLMCWGQQVKFAHPKHPDAALQEVYDKHGHLKEHHRSWLRKKIVRYLFPTICWVCFLMGTVTYTYIGAIYACGALMFIQQNRMFFTNPLLVCRYIHVFTYVMLTVKLFYQAPFVGHLGIPRLGLHKLNRSDGSAFTVHGALLDITAFVLITVMRTIVQHPDFQTMLKAVRADRIKSREIAKAQFEMMEDDMREQFEKQAREKALRKKHLEELRIFQGSATATEGDNTLETVMNWEADMARKVQEARTHKEEVEAEIERQRHKSKWQQFAHWIVSQDPWKRLDDYLWRKRRGTMSAHPNKRAGEEDEDVVALSDDDDRDSEEMSIKNTSTRGFPVDSDSGGDDDKESSTSSDNMSEGKGNEAKALLEAAFEEEVVYVDRPDAESVPEEGAGTTKTYGLMDVMQAMGHWLQFNSQLICFVLFIMVHTSDADVLSVMYPVAMLVYGVTRRIRTAGFWDVMLIYTQSCTMLKFFFQFGFVCACRSSDGLWRYTMACGPDVCHVPQATSTWSAELAMPRVIGLFKFEQSFFASTYWDLLLLAALCYHRHMRNKLGIDTLARLMDTHVRRAFERHQNRVRAMEAATAEDAAEDLMPSTRKGMALLDELFPSDASSHPSELWTASDMNENQSTASTARPVAPKLGQLGRSKGAASLNVGSSNSLFGSTEAGSRVPVRDWWAWLGYSGYKPGRDWYVWQFVIEFILFIYLLAFFPLYTDSNANGQGESLTDFVVNNRIPGPLVFAMLSQFGLLIVDRVLYLYRALALKTVVHFCMVITQHVLITFWLPDLARVAFANNIALRTLYVLKAIAMWLSAMQVADGYPRYTYGQFLMRYKQVEEMYAYIVYRSIPFVYELRSLLDWICTKTTMTFFEWLKLEDIYSQLYAIQCDRNYYKRYPRSRGDKVRADMKIGQGVAIFVALVFLVWSPLLLMSTGTPLMSKNLLIRTDVSCLLTGYPPLYQLEMAARITNTTESEVNVWQKQYEMPELGTEEGLENSQLLRMTQGSQYLWDISPTSYDSMMLRMSDPRPFELTTTLSFVRRGPPVSPVIKMSYSHQLNKKQRDSLFRILNETQELGSSDEVMVVPDLLPRFIEVPATGVPRPMSNRRDYTFNVTAYISLNQSSRGLPFWVIRQEPGPAFPGEDLTMVTLSARFPSGVVSQIASLGVVGLYVGVVLSVGRFLRLSLTGLGRDAMFTDLPDVTSLMQLCDDLYAARQDEDLMLEETLYHELLDVYRSPVLLMRLTGTWKDKYD